MSDLDLPEIARLRMINLGLWSEPEESSTTALGRLGAIQAQEYLPAKWSLAQRTRGDTHDDVEKALDQAAIVRTHILRPTWHFVAARDLRWMLAVSGPRVRAKNALVEARQALDPKTLSKSISIIAKLLENECYSTRDEIALVLEKRGGVRASGERLAYIMMSAELDGVICSGPRRGKQHTYALVDERIPAGPPVDGEAALFRLASLFFTTRGPATVKDFATWATQPIADAKRAIAHAAVSLEPITIGADTYWWGGPAPAVDQLVGPHVDLVQCYDECLASYTQSKNIMMAIDVERRGNGSTVLPHAVMIDGRLRGHWRHVPGKESGALETWFPKPLSRAETESLEAASLRARQFFDSR